MIRSNEHAHQFQRNARPRPAERARTFDVAAARAGWVVGGWQGRRHLGAAADGHRRTLSRAIERFLLPSNLARRASSIIQACWDS
jgi:hypothetical protein